jgi:hypothetical protein
LLEVQIILNSQRTGAQTVINSDKIKALPSFVEIYLILLRLTPQAQLRGDDVCLLVDKTTDSMQFILMELLVMTFWFSCKWYQWRSNWSKSISIDAIEQFREWLPMM